MTLPAWSVIVPTRDRPRQLASCMQALLRVSSPAGGFEVIVVNDGGHQPTFEDVMRNAAREASLVRFVTQPNTGPAGARNAGARLAAGSWLAFTDDDCEPSTDWLQALERALNRDPTSLAGGVVRNVVADSVFSEASQLLVGFVVDWFKGESREPFFSSNNIALSRAAFLEAGGFDEGFGTSAGEDREFCDRWYSQGRSAVLVEDARVDHRHELSLRSFIRQHHGYGRAAHRFRQRRRSAGRSVRIEPGFYVASLRHALRSQPVIRGAALAGCTMLAHTAYAAGLVRENWRSSRPDTSRVEHT